MSLQQALPLIDFIVETESRGDWNAVWFGISKADRPTRPVTTMTIQEVLDWQDRIDPKYRSEAAGGPQFLEDTLRGLYTSAGCKPSDVFSIATQRKLAYQLLRRRGLDRYMGGLMTAEAFCDQLAKEWASLPVMTGKHRGLSYYGGDGMNHALTTPERILSIVTDMRAAPAPEPAPAATGGFFAALLAALFRRKS